MLEDFQSMLQLKTNAKRDLSKKIERYSKQENVIIKVLDKINNNENRALFEENDIEINRRYEEIEKQWNAKMERLKNLKIIKETFNDIDYFAANCY
mmetsp:Transcript_1964/g.3441  ORF Transcript_1964/g.3441 Transcript_1964/m.3441 type:complete len:96 (-) Transcript_1964:123-410(-)